MYFFTIWAFLAFNITVSCTSFRHFPSFFLPFLFLYRPLFSLSLSLLFSMESGITKTLSGSRRVGREVSFVKECGCGLPSVVSRREGRPGGPSIESSRTNDDSGGGGGGVASTSATLVGVVSRSTLTRCLLPPLRMHSMSRTPLSLSLCLFTPGLSASGCFWCCFYYLLVFWSRLNGINARVNVMTRSYSLRAVSIPRSLAILMDDSKNERKKVWLIECICLPHLQQLRKIRSNDSSFLQHDNINKIVTDVYLEQWKLLEIPTDIFLYQVFSLIINVQTNGPPTAQSGAVSNNVYFGHTNRNFWR